MYLPTSLQELQTSSAYMKIGDFPDEPIPPEVLNPSKKPKSEDISHILGRTGRKVKKNATRWKLSIQKSVLLLVPFPRHAS